MLHTVKKLAKYAIYITGGTALASIFLIDADNRGAEQGALVVPDSAFAEDLSCDSCSSCSSCSADSCSGDSGSGSGDSGSGDDGQGFDM